MKYRASTHADIPVMARIRAAEWGDAEYWQTRIRKYMDCEAHPQKALDPRAVFVAESEGTVVGFIAGHLTTRFECDGELQWINVEAGRRGEGIADGLLGLLFGWFIANGARKVCVDCDPGNPTARRFYMKHGAEELNPHWLVWNDIRRFHNDP